MNNTILLVLIISVVVFVLVITYNTYTPITNTVVVKPSTKASLIQKHSLYSEDETKEKPQVGFVNELIYKPKNSMSEFSFETGVINNPISLNEFIDCEESTNLPLGNINVNYLVKNNLSKLS